MYFVNCYGFNEIVRLKAHIVNSYSEAGNNIFGGFYNVCMRALAE